MSTVVEANVTELELPLPEPARRKRAGGGKVRPVPKGWYTIETASDKLGITAARVRQLVTKGLLKSVQDEIANGSFRHLISHGELYRYLTTPVTRTVRPDGTRKYILYATEAQLEALQEWLKDQDMSPARLPVVRSRTVPSEFNSAPTNGAGAESHQAETELPPF